MSDSKILEFKAKSNPLPHAKQPVLCESCQAEIEKVAVAGGDGQHIQYCDHNYVFAVATVRMATVLQYDLVGPILGTCAIDGRNTVHHNLVGVLIDRRNGMAQPHPLAEPVSERLA